MHTAKIQLLPREDAPTISPNIYGHFAEHLGRCIYEGIWVGEGSTIPNRNGIRSDVVEALKQINIPVLRWPGGCFADEYHWKDGVGPRESRKRIYNSHWGGVVENNHFGTHEFFELCEQLGCKSYVCGNVGSGTVQEMSEWVEYMTSPSESPMANWRRENGRQDPWKLDFFGVGNESWGCGGNMRPEYYADEYRRYNTFVRTYGGAYAQRIACGANTADYHWTEVMMERAKDHMDGLSLHNYTLLNQKWPPSGSATEFGEAEWHSILEAALNTEALIVKHSEIMDKHDPERKVGLIVDEWGVWYPVEPGTNPGFLYQQNSLRDAMVAALHFHAFQRHANRVTMANIAQTINVLQAMILTDGPRMVRTPTYWVFEMFKGHQGGQFIPTEVQIESSGKVPAVDLGASQKGEVVTLTAACTDPNIGATVEVKLSKLADIRQARVLSAATIQSHNTFDDPEAVSPQAYSDWTVDSDLLTLHMPPHSIVALDLE